MDTSQRTRRPSPVLLVFALVFMFAAGVNAATHHWWDMAGELAMVATLLWLRTWNFEVVLDG